jgi:enediyne biosynthesis protein E4
LLIGNGHIIDNIDRARPGSGISYAQRCLLQLNDGKGRFKNVVSELPAALAAPRVVRALALCDYDDDGDLDVALGQNNARGVLLRNDATRVGRSVTILPRDAKGRIALGVSAEIEAGGKKRVVFAHATGSYCAAGDPRLTIGVAESRIDALTLRWPTGETLRLEGVEPGRYLIVEPRGIVEQRPAR